MGTTWLYPPPAAPPLMPNVGPIDGCRIATVARLPMCLNPCPRPTVVVVLPSPSGVGVIALTTTYLAVGPVGQLRDGLELDLHHLLAVRLEQVRGDAHRVRDVLERLQRRAAGDLQVAREDHGVPLLNS